MKQGPKDKDVDEAAKEIEKAEGKNEEAAAHDKKALELLAKKPDPAARKRSVPKPAPRPVAANRPKVESLKELIKVREQREKPQEEANHLEEKLQTAEKQLKAAQAVLQEKDAALAAIKARSDKLERDFQKSEEERVNYFKKENEKKRSEEAEKVRMKPAEDRGATLFVWFLRNSNKPPFLLSKFL